VTPIFKKGDKTKVQNYRPISLLSYPAKLFETLVHKQIYHHVEKYLSNTQHGFCEGRSTTTNLCSLWDFVTESIDEGFQVDVIYTDFSKAFDSVNHDFLIHKLSNLGIHGKLLSWCATYLRGRRQKVIFNGGCSQYVTIPSGVPQGSALGPLFFVIFINDLALKLSELGIPHLFYADDLKIFFKIKSSEDHLMLQKGANCLSDWCKTWGLLLNLEKCQVTTFHSYRNLSPYFHSYTLNNTTIARVNTVKDLGVLFQSNCLFNHHINSIVNKAFKMLGFLKRTLYFITDMKTVITMYNATVRSIVSYASVVWSPNQVYMINDIERIQRNFIRYLCNKFKYDRDDQSTTRTKCFVKNLTF